MMPKIFITDTMDNKLTYYHMLFFMLALPFDRFYSTLILISFVSRSLLFINLKNIVFPLYSIIMLQSVFFITLISLAWSGWRGNGIELLTKQSAIFIFPLLFSINKSLILKYRNVLLEGYATGLTFTVVYLFVQAFHIIRYNSLPLKAIYSPAFVNHNFSLPIGMHATYLSMMLVIATMYILKEIFATRLLKKKLWLTFILLVLSAGLLQLGSKSVLVAFLLILNIGFPLFCLKNKRRKLFIVVSLLVCTALVIFIANVNVFYNRYITMFEDELAETHGVAEMNGRADRWKAAADLIQLSPVFGTGAGSETVLLRNLYYERKMYGPYLHSLNAHNQYLGLLISAGIFGLIIFVATLGWGFLQACREQDILLMAFLSVVSIVAISEDIMDVNKGIFFYSFFFSFLFFSLAGKASLKSTGAT